MDQFRQIGEVVGSMKALMVLKHEIVINQRQCCFLLDVFVQAFDKISDEIKQNLRLDERSAKWKPLERPLRELHRVFKEGESYIKSCIDIKNWLGKAVSLHLNNDCVELHVHNVLSCFVVVIEAIEAAAEISGLDEELMQKRRLALLKKSCDSECNDPKLFQWKYGDQYLVSRETCILLEGIWREDKWLLLELLRQKKKKQTKLLADALINKLNGSETDGNKLLPTSLLLESDDYHVKRRIGSTGSHLKEIQWLGESFGLRTFYGDIELLRPEIDMVMSMCHPNVLQYHCGFYDEERKEGFLVMEVMTKSLDVLIKENSGQRKRMSFSIPVAVDLMLQVARGMEYLHTRNVCHGELNPSNILLRPMGSFSGECYFHVKVGGFGLSLLKSQYTHRSCPRPGADDSLVWCAPEVVAEKAADVAKHSEKAADVYSFGMLCFQILTGKAPFEEWERPLQGDKMVYSLMAGERPLFPHSFPKYLINLIKKCWQTSPSTRPSFSAICRILWYMKKVLIINPDHGQPGCPPPLVEYCDIEDGFTKKFHKNGVLPAVSEIPFHMFAYKLVEKEKTSRNDVTCDPGEHLVSIDDLCVIPNDGSHRRSACSEIIDRKDLGTYADQRSVLSEIPYSKPSLGDHISTLSDETSAAFADSPDWKLLSALPKSHSMSATGSINKFKFSESAQKKKPVAERKGMCSEVLGKKDSTPKRVFTAEPKPVRPDEASEKTSSAAGKKVGDTQTAVHSEPTRTKFLSNMKAKFRLTKIPEKKTLGSITARPPASPDSPHKATTSNPRKTLKNAIINYSVKGKQQSNEAAGTMQQYRSPGASPARVTRTNSLGRFSSPLSSPLHPSKVLSPARLPPSRSMNSCPSPSLRAIKDKPQESFMSPRRQMKVV
ncbi:unnamed protein product [Cuscuta campestris]|uniref:Protein kinase domain-containing protein n=1 Tax=Cuscuta campestris TaxID=132261 RepID=A0A484MXM7_9ASTE|nr:unnamed protein product [Cuscuta campestris]